MVFDSKKEYSFWLMLKRQEELGIIKDLQRQVPFTLIPKSKWGRERKYIADFVYFDIKQNKIIIADCKSSFTEKNTLFQFKARLFSELYDMEITILK